MRQLYYTLQTLLRGHGACLLALIVLVVVIKAWRIANENPVKSIKNE